MLICMPHVDVVDVAHVDGGAWTHRSIRQARLDSSPCSSCCLGAPGQCRRSRKMDLEALEEDSEFHAP